MFFLSDIGRTKTRLAVSLDGQTISEPIIRPTPADFNQGLNLIKELIEELGKGQKRDGLCLGISRKVWSGAPLKPELEETFGGPVYLVNDSALVGLGEAHYGAGRNQRLAAYLTVSSGVGGVLIVNGQIAENALGFEPGHQLIVVGEQVRSLEELVSGFAIEAQFGRPPHEITNEKIWQELSRYLALGLVNTLVHWSPDCLILGGGMFKTPGFQITVIEKLISEHLTIFSKRPLIRPAALGEIGGLYGALAYLQGQFPGSNS
ncbi:MAG: ROK family protein [Patescibacteria group bacterium]